MNCMIFLKLSKNYLKLYLKTIIDDKFYFLFIRAKKL